MSLPYPNLPFNPELCFLLPREEGTVTHEGKTIKDNRILTQKFIFALRSATNWLECSTFTEYQPEVRSVWRERGLDWLDISGACSGNSKLTAALGIEGEGYLCSRAETDQIIEDLLVRLEGFYEASKDLVPNYLSR